jgi:hypothetical protein
MSATAKSMKRTRQGGQTLIIALLILGVLLILGSVFLGIIARNINTGVRSTQRSVGNDLAEAGIRYAHGQLLRSGLGADWRVPLSPAASNRDPDFDYLKPGGPDGLGNYGRINYDQGRALVRVRYGPSDANLFAVNPAGPLIIPGRAKNYLIIESIGKPGKADPNDPTIARDLTGAERERLQTRKLIAFASIGITEQAFFVTNKYNVSRAVEFGAPNEVGARYQDDPAGAFANVQVPTQIGDVQVMPDKNGGFTAQPYGGSIRINGDAIFHGPIRANINKYYGDSILVTGSMVGADDVTSILNVNGADLNAAGNWVPFAYTLANAAATSLNSRSDNFSTARGTVMDGVVSADRDGYTRGVRRIEGSSFLMEDTATGESIYRTMARDSGQILAGGNSGAFGHGRNVYVNNTSDRQNRTDEQGREIAETNESLVYDWLNPNNSQANSGWQGPFYVPRGAYLQLAPDGFAILRDTRGPANERTWRDPAGNDTSNSLIRYRIGSEIVNGRPRMFIINNIANPAEMGQPNPDYRAGMPFDGVLYFEGNVRVRGIIPTDVQLTVVSNATIYVEGSITKGVVDNQVHTPNLASATGGVIGTSSKSMLMLAAKDYTAINTSQFFGPAPQQVMEEANDLATASEYNPVRMRRQSTPGTPSSYLFRAELPFDPESGNPANPQTWKPFAAGYQEFNTANFINSGILITHTMDDGPATNSFISLDVNFGLDNVSPNPADWQYLFDLNRTPPIAPINIFDPFQQNNASDYAPYTTPGYVENFYGGAQTDRGPIYGLGAESWQRYGKFETTFFPVAESNGTGGAYTAYPFIPNPPEHGTYLLLAGETNDFTFRFNDIGTNPSNDYLIARAAMVPNDVRIEASLYAEEGSFFVIPSPWFNPNPNDRRDLFLARVVALGNNAAAVQQAQAERYQNFGSAPITPFYGEPIDVRVKVVGAVSQNMPAPMSQQAEWLKKWGWIPRSLGTTGRVIPAQHVPAGYDLAADLFVPNLIITYDPALGSGRAWDPAFSAQGPFYWQNPPLRVDDDNRMLAPMPRLPVSPTLAYFGEVNQ